MENFYSLFFFLVIVFPLLFRRFCWHVWLSGELFLIGAFTNYEGLKDRASKFTALRADHQLSQESLQVHIQHITGKQPSIPPKPRCISSPSMLESFYCTMEMIAMAFDNGCIDGNSTIKFQENFADHYIVPCPIQNSLLATPLSSSRTKVSRSQLTSYKP